MESNKDIDQIIQGNTLMETQNNNNIMGGLEQNKQMVIIIIMIIICAILLILFIVFLSLYLKNRENYEKIETPNGIISQTFTKGDDGISLNTDYNGNVIRKKAFIYKN